MIAPAASIAASHLTHEPPSARPRYFTPGVWVVTFFAALGGAVWLYRMGFGLGSSTNLTNAYPWGIWIGIDVATGVALAAGGFTTAFLAHILHREKYHPLVRPALLTAMIGYTFVALGVATDLGRFWAMWHVMLPMFWQPNSVLFEVAICVMCYLSVLYIEFLPAACERYIGRVNLPGPAARFNGLVDRGLRIADATLGRVMTVFIMLGIMLSCMHQSSLGTLMVIADSKLYAYWQTPLLPVLFLLSAFSVGYPMVIFESIIAHRSFKLPGERSLLADLGRFIPFTLGTYLTVKLGDLAYRGQLMHIFEGGRYSVLLLTELGCGVAIPILIFAVRPLREKTPIMFLGATLAILGVVLNRLNVFLFGYSPLDRTATYFPSLGEFAVTIGFIAMTVMIYRFFAINLPVIEQLEPGHHGHGEHTEHGHAAAAAHSSATQVPQPAGTPAREAAALVAVGDTLEHEDLQAVGCGAATNADHHSPSRSTP